MKAAVALALTLLCAAPTPSRAAAPPRPLRVPAYRPERVRPLVLRNGLTLFLREEPRLPLVRGLLLVRAGSRDEPARQAGLTTLASRTWSSRLAQERQAQTRALLDLNSARLEISAAPDWIAVSWESAAAAWPAVFELVSGLLREPRFAPADVELAKYQLFSALAQAGSDPAATADRAVLRLAYGDSSPCARAATGATLGLLGEDDLSRWHRTYVRPENILIGLTGGVRRGPATRLLRRALEGWSPPPAPAPPAPSACPLVAPRAGVHLLDRPGLTRSHVRVVGPGLQRDDAGYYASQVFNQVFAAGPDARLLAGLRTRRALVYSASGGIGAAYDHPGVLSLATTCRPEVTAQVIAAILAEIRALLVSGVSRAEVDAAREALLNSFVFRFDTQEKVLRSAMELFFYGRPADSADRYRAGIESVTAAQVDDVARRCLSPERLAIVVVGDAARFDRPLAEFGPLSALE